MDVDKKELPKKIEEIRTRVFIGEKGASHTSAFETVDAFENMSFDNSRSLDAFKENFQIQILKLTDDEMVFDMIGVDAPIANAFRRILLAEVPTMAIEKVVMFQNTSIIQDEVLSHRLGLIPFKADPRKFKYLHESDYEPNEENTLVFTLDVECTRNPDKKDSAPAHEKFTNSIIRTDSLTWVPQGIQAQKFTAEDVSPTYDDIVIAKLRPGQCIQAELHLVKGVGKDHMKWSPVATASYRLLPEINFSSPVTGNDAKALVKLCPLDVFDIEDIGGVPTARTANPRNCSMCRECIRDGPGKDKVELRRVRDHFIFSIETTGAYSPQNVFKAALREFAKKCQNMLEALKEVASTSR